jgi:hypothetical protein
MRVIRNLTGTLLVAGLASLAYAAVPPTAGARMTGYDALSAAQQDQTTPPKQDEKKQDETKPPKQTREPKEAKPPKGEKQQAEPKQQAAGRQEQQQGAVKPQKSMQTQKGQGQAGGQHGRISDSDYQAHFGRQHSFSVRQVVTTTTVVPNQTQFVYGGYTFIFIEAWPSDWAWSDDCYIDYIDGEYVLIDLVHPGMQITLEIAG